MPQKTHTSFQKKAYDLRRRCSTGKPDEFQSTGRHSGRPHFQNTAQVRPSAFSEDPVRAYAYFYPSNTLKIYIFLHFPLMGSMVGTFYWVIPLAFQAIKHQPLSTAQPFRNARKPHAAPPCRRIRGRGSSLPTAGALPPIGTRRTLADGTHQSGAPPSHGANSPTIPAWWTNSRGPTHRRGEPHPARHP